MYKFVYKNKKTGKKVYSNKKLDDKNLVIVNETRSINIKNSDVIKK